MRTVAAVTMFLFGTTFVWLTALFAGRPTPPTGTAWMLVNVLALGAVAGFATAAWGLYRDHHWWDLAALTGAVIGLLAIALFFVGLRQINQNLGDLGIQINLWLHIVGALAVIALARVPTVNDWFAARLA